MLPVFLGTQNNYDFVNNDVRKGLSSVDERYFREATEIMANPLFHFKPPFGTPYGRTKTLLKWEMEEKKVKEVRNMFRTAVEFSMLGTDSRYAADANFLRDVEFAKTLGDITVNVAKYNNYTGKKDALGRERSYFEQALAQSRRQNFGLQMAQTQNWKDLNQDTEEHLLRIALLDNSFQASANPVYYQSFMAAQKVFPRFIHDSMKKPDIVASASSITQGDKRLMAEGIIRGNLVVPAASLNDVDAIKDIQKNIARICILHTRVLGLGKDPHSAKSAAEVLMTFFPGDPGLQAVLDADNSAKAEDMRGILAQYGHSPAGHRLEEIELNPEKVLIAAVIAGQDNNSYNAAA